VSEGKAKQMYERAPAMASALVWRDRITLVCSVESQRSWVVLRTSASLLSENADLPDAGRQTEGAYVSAREY